MQIYTKKSPGYYTPIIFLTGNEGILPSYFYSKFSNEIA